MEDLAPLGWDRERAAELAACGVPTLAPARVAVVYQDRLRVAGAASWAELSGRMRHAARSGLERPAVGDWVALEPNESGMATVHKILSRRTQLIRHAAGRRAEPQVIAANLDRVFLVTSANREFNARRLERYLAAIRQSGAAPGVVLNKIDLCPDPAPLLEQIAALAPGVPTVAVSARERRGASSFRGLLREGQTIALIGSSGVGKSTLINWLFGQDIQAVRSIREGDAKGRHTTTHRELFVLAERPVADDEAGEVPLAGVLIDTPGMRELKLWGDAPALDETFTDVEAAAAECRFRDCSHEHEPGCAVLEAVAAGRLTAERVAGYRKLRLDQTTRARRFASYRSRSGRTRTSN
ncbi:MAG: ribosome small subunit-dependent GTPase A [Myxococcales bacterium]|nr:ribosome small subunit-dependent GTPase A [Myxococcales bacterium]